MFLWSTAVSGMTGPRPHKNCDMLPADVAVAAWARVMSLSSSSSLNGSLGMNASGLGYPFADLADERTQSWPLVASPWSACLILALYLLLVHWGPRCMARWVWHTHCQHCSNVSSLLPSSFISFSRKPLQLRLPLFCYNLLMATLNAHICLELYTAARALNYSAKCQPCRVSYDPNELRVSSHERKRFPVHNQAKENPLSACQRLLVVLRLKDSGIRRHGFLYTAQEVVAIELPACLSSQQHVHHLLDCRQVDTHRL